MSADRVRDQLTVPALIASIAIGVWLLAAPELTDIDGAARLSHLVVGPVVASLATIALWPVARLVARANVLLGAWLAVAPLFLAHGGLWWESVIAGAAIALLAWIPRGRAHRFGGGWGSLLRPGRER